MSDLIDGGNNPTFLGLEREYERGARYDDFDGEALIEDFDGFSSEDEFSDFDYSNFLSSPGFKLFKEETGGGRRQWKKLSASKQNEYKTRAGKSKVGGFIDRNVSSIKDDINDALDKVAPGAVKDAEYCNENYGTKKGPFTAKRASLTLPRSAYLGLIKLNYRGLATRMGAFYDKDRANWRKLEKKYCTLGGGTDSFLKAVKQGQNKKPLICGAKCKAKLPRNFSGFAIDASSFDYNYPTGAEETAAAAATASPVLASIGGTLTAISAVTGPAADIANDVERAVGKDEAKDDAGLTPEEKQEIENNFKQAQEEILAAVNEAGIGGAGANKLLVYGLIAVTGFVLLNSIKK